MNKKLHLWLKEKRISVILLQRILKFLWSRGASMRNCNKKKKRRGLFILVLLAFMLLWSPFLGETGDSLLGVHTVQAATRHVTARYWSTDGRTSYTKLRTKVKYGGKITLPNVPSVNGYVNLGWSTEKNATKATYKAGKTLRLKKNMSLYAVRKKVGSYKVYFYTNAGKSSRAYKKLNKSVTRGAYLTLPALPAKSGYQAAGWTTVKGSSKVVYQAGQKIRVKKNTRLYAVYVSSVSVTLCKNDGTVYKTMSVAAGSRYVLPAVRNATGYTFMGWDTQPGKQLSPCYEAGESITVSRNMKLYAVVFNRSREEELSESELLASSGWRIGGGSGRGYSHVIFVGDSRTARMELTLKKQFGSDSNIMRDIDFVCQEGKGLDWLKQTGIQQIISLAESKYSVQRPTAVIFNLGVNDPGNMYEYVSYLQQIAGTLKQKNCKLFFMSVNPVNSRTIEYMGKNAIRKEEVIRRFNSVVSSGTSGNYTYIDAYSFLLQNGYSTDIGGAGSDYGVDDGLHYTTKTYKRIFKYCLDYLTVH